MADTITGGCACGAVRYEITGDLGFSFLCQCRRCQHTTGAGHAAQFLVDNGQLAVTGALASHEVAADSGFTVCHRFCPRCGSPILGVTTRAPDKSLVHAGSLDDPSIFKPQKVVFHESAQPWDYIDPTLTG